MENVLKTYEKPYDSSRPVICMDEQPVQLVKETRGEIPAPNIPAFYVRKDPCHITHQDVLYRKEFPQSTRSL